MAPQTTTCRRASRPHRWPTGLRSNRRAGCHSRHGRAGAFLAIATALLALAGCGGSVPSDAELRAAYKRGFVDGRFAAPPTKQATVRIPRSTYNELLRRASAGDVEDRYRESLSDGFDPREEAFICPQGLCE